MRPALDTNVLVYAEGIGDADRCRRARHWVVRAAQAQAVIPLQVLGELHRVLVVKGRRSPADARMAVIGWADSFEVVDGRWPTMQAALDLCADHQLAMWDALILATAADARCRVLLSDDLQQGFTWRGITVVNPFSEPGHPLLARLPDHSHRD
jgi:predicted nucleic acid-binding protein